VVSNPDSSGILEHFGVVNAVLVITPHQPDSFTDLDQLKVSGVFNMFSQEKISRGSAELPGQNPVP
jgi:hypothetical protein